MREIAAFTICLLCAPRVLPASQTGAGMPSAALQSSSTEPSAYAVLIDRLIAGDRAVDFTVLRMAFTQTAGYSAMMMRFYQPLWRTLAARDFENAIKLADSVLRQNFVEANAHLVAAAAHEELGTS